MKVRTNGDRVPRRHRPIIRMAVLGSLWLLLLASWPASAADKEYRLWDKVDGTLGGYLQTTSTNLQVRGTSEEDGEEIDFEKDAGLDDSESLFRLSVRFLPKKRSEFGVGYYAQSRSAMTVTEEDLEFGDIFFPAGTEVDSTFATDTYQLNYTNWAIRKERLGFGPMVGFVAMRIQASLRAVEEDIDLSGRVSFDVPVIMIGAGFKYALLPTLNFSSWAILLPNVTFGDISGEASDFALRLDYRPWRNIGFGASWSSFSIDVDIDTTDFQGHLDYTTEGAQLFMVFAF